MINAGSLKTSTQGVLFISEIKNSAARNTNNEYIQTTVWNTWWRKMNSDVE